MRLLSAKHRADSRYVKATCPEIYKKQTTLDKKATPKRQPRAWNGHQ